MTARRPSPVALHPGETMTIEIGLGPTATYPPSGVMGLPAGGCLFHTPVTSVFAFGLAEDNAAPLFAVLSPPTLLASAREWTAEACTKPAMLALIPPATNSSTYSIRPELITDLCMWSGVGVALTWYGGRVTHRTSRQLQDQFGCDSRGPRDVPLPGVSVIAAGAR